MAGDIGGLIMVDGRGWNDDVPPESAVDRFNRMAMDNPTFGRNLVLERLSKFNNASYYKLADDEPELDCYSQTLYVNGDGVTDSATGDAYGEFKKMQEDLSGNPGADSSTGCAYPELAAASAADFIAQFGKIFAEH